MKFNNTIVEAQFDSGNFIGTFIIHNKKLKYLNCRDERFEQLELLISGVVDKFLEE